ncbi:MAG: dehydrogenase-like protein / Selenide,water dikinase [Planctomycetaceae bacterium]|nr:dehydrogenase-like protein / Selenide,water dikinase [Planctomycetaceae bacterium]
MNSPPQFTRDLILVGAGHTNLHIVRQWRMRPVRDVQLTLISPFSRATYSGMLPGTLAGLYRPEEMQIDLYRFTAGTGIRLIVAEATGLLPDERLITFADRAPMRFDVAAVGIGSVPGQRELWEHSSRVLSIKPMATFLSRLEAAVSRHPVSQPLRCVIVGSGAGGTEIAFCLDQWLQRRGIAHHLTLLDGHDEILPGYVPAFIRRARRLLDERGIEVHLGQHVAAVSESAGRDLAELRLSGGATLTADIIIWATSASPPTVLDQFKLPKTDGGFLAVRATLQTTADVPVFVVGDTASFVDQRVPKAGVYAVREGPILWENLQNMLAGRDLVDYRPQRDFLSLLATGDGRALLQYKGWTQHGTWAWKLKDHIDRKFMRMYQDYQPPQMAGGESSRATVMHCGGCGSKVGSELLSRVLQRLRTAFPEITKSIDAPDDAFVLAPQVIRPEVFSVDYFRAFLDDPYLLGRVTVLHALSDLWAMGAVPRGVQAIVTLPYGSVHVQQELLLQLLSGAARELAACGVELWGGHTIEGPQLQLGFSVAGQLNGTNPWRKSGLRPGDHLLLTKRLGTGTLLAAHQRGLCRAEWFDQMVAEMLVSNQQSREVAREFDVYAATDVTGFGLGGHLLEMLTASRCSAVISSEALSRSLLPGFAELAGEGIESTLAPANRESVRSHLAKEHATTNGDLAALIDPQTSGGLLLGVAVDQVAELLSAMRTVGYTNAVQIGVVHAEAGVPKIVVDRSAIITHSQ